MILKTSEEKKKFLWKYCSCKARLSWSWLLWNRGMRRVSEVDLCGYTQVPNCRVFIEIMQGNLNEEPVHNAACNILHMQAVRSSYLAHDHVLEAACYQGCNRARAPECNNSGTMWKSWRKHLSGILFPRPYTFGRKFFPHNKFGPNLKP